MLNITQDAMQICRSTVNQLGKGQDSARCLRLVRSSDQLAVSMEVPEKRDRIIEYGGRAVLAIPEDTADDLDGRTLDVLDDGCLVVS